MSIALESDQTLYVKGGIEEILSICKLSSSKKLQILEQAKEYEEDAYYLLATATRSLAGKKVSIEQPDKLVKLEQDLELKYLLAFRDPIKKEVKQAVAKCHDAKIRLMMITGDTATTAKAIASEIGFFWNRPADHFQRRTN